MQEAKQFEVNGLVNLTTFMYGTKLHLIMMIFILKIHSCLQVQ